MKFLKGINWHLLLIMLYLGALFSPALGGTAYASNITNAMFYGVITVSNNATIAANTQAATTNVNTPNLITDGYFNAGANNTVMRNVTTSADVPFMPGYSSNPWIMQVDSMSSNSYLSYYLYSGTVSGGKLAYFPDTGGMQASDPAGMELASNFSVELSGYFDTSASSNQSVIYKSNAFRIYVSGVGTIKATTLNGADAEVVTVTKAVSAGEHVLVVSADGANLSIEVDAGGATTAAIGAGVPNTAGNWTYLLNGSMPYLLYSKIYVGGNLKQSLAWNYGSTFTDLSGNGNTATPTFRTTGSLSAMLTSFHPVSESQASNSTSSSSGFLPTPTMTSGFQSSLTPFAFPGADIVANISSDSGTPSQLYWFMVTGFVVLTLSLTLSWAMRSFNSGSLLIKGLFVFLCMGILTGLRVYDWWMIVLYILPVIAIMFASQDARRA